ncbi:MAG: SEC-C metal-binding domain-containing protein [Egibacteraceae bacterium]
MPGPGRNERCPCGSGRKVKRCCGQRKGPGEEQVARAFLGAQLQAAAIDLVSYCHHNGREGLVELLDVVAELPASYEELVVDLPRLAHPDLQPLRREIERDDLRKDSPALRAAIAVIDSPVVRARLARTVLRLRDEGVLDPCVAAAAVADLSAPDSLLIEASLIQALLIDTGRVTRSSGLLIAH